MPALTDHAPNARARDAIARIVAQLPQHSRERIALECGDGGDPELVSALAAIASTPPLKPPPETRPSARTRRQDRMLAKATAAQVAASALPAATNVPPELGALPAPRDNPRAPRAQRRAIGAAERAAGARPWRRARYSSKTTAERQAAKQRRRQRKDDRHLDHVRARELRYRAWREARGEPVPSNAKPAAWSREAWAMRTECFWDPTDRAIRIHLERLSRRWPHAVGAIRRAALVPTPEGETVYDFTCSRARMIAILLMGILMESRRITGIRAIHDRHGRWCHLTAGFSVGYLQAFLTNPITGEVPSRAAIVGWPTAPGDRVLNALRARRMPCDDGMAVLLSAECGWLNAGKLAGFCFSRQPRPELGDKLLPCELMTGGEGRFATARYVIVGRPIDQTLVPERDLAAHAALELLGWLDLGDDARLSRQARAYWRALFTEPLPLGPPPDG